MDSGGEVPRELKTVFASAEAIARAQGHDRLRSMHLTVAILSDRYAPWPGLILERGGFTYRSALRRLRWRPPAEPEPATDPRPNYRSSMRLTLLVAAALAVALLVGFIRRALAVARPAQVAHRLELTPEAVDVTRLAGALARGQGAEASPSVGHFLLALASTPGDHLKVLPNTTVLACAIRKRLGLAGFRHRLILACDNPKRITRRVHIRIDREIAVKGWRSMWGVAWLLYGAAGVLGAITVFFLKILTTALLYCFLWPAALLMAGIRTLCGTLVGCDARSYRWLDVPGGDVAVTQGEPAASPRVVAAALLAPRLLAAGLCILTMTVLLWRSVDLGISVAPILLRRPDLVAGAAPEGFWLGPASILFGMLEENGTLAGIGLLAGLGAGMMSIPTFREVELIRLHGGHDIGGGSRFTRAITAPASLFTGAVSCVEAVLPFTGAPIYATAYLVPLFCSLLVAIVLLQVLPY